MPDIQLIFPPEEENITLLFPTDTPEIDVGVTLTFEDISGYLPTSRLEGDIPTSMLEGDIPITQIDGDLPVNRIEDVSGLMTASEAHNIWDNA